MIRIDVTQRLEGTTARGGSLHSQALSELERIQEILEHSRLNDTPVDAQLVKVAHRRLHRTAQRLLGVQVDSMTLGPTALVNEGFVRMWLATELFNRDAEQNGRNPAC